MKGSNTRSMNLQQILRKSVLRLETDFQHKLIIIITHENGWQPSEELIVAVAWTENPVLDWYELK